MSFFTVEEIEKPVYESYADGKYKVEIIDVEKKSNNFDGIYIEIQRQFLDGEYEGTIWTKKYKINSDHKTVKHIARQDISKLAINVARIQTGEDLQPEHLIGKVTEIVVRNEPNQRGDIFCNIKRELLIEDSQPTGNDIPGSGIQIPQTPAPALPSDTLNDAVPFF